MKNDKKHRFDFDKETYIKTKKKRKYKCAICKSINHSIFIYSMDELKDAYICAHCHSVMKALRFNGYSLVKDDEIVDSGIYDFGRNSLRNWKVSYFIKFKNYRYDTGLDTIHHFIFNFIDILKTSMKICGIEYCSKINEIENSKLNELKHALTVIHYFYGYGFIMTSQEHEELHKEYGYRIDAKVLKDEIIKRHPDKKYMLNRMFDLIKNSYIRRMKLLKSNYVYKKYLNLEDK